MLVNNWHSQKNDSFFNQCVSLEESPIQQTMQMYLDAVETISRMHQEYLAEDMGAAVQ